MVSETPRNAREDNELIIYQLKELRISVDKGFATIEAKQGLFDNRLLALEKNSIKTEYDIKALQENQRELQRPPKESKMNTQLVKIIGTALAVLTTALAIIYALINKGG